MYKSTSRFVQRDPSWVPDTQRGFPGEDRYVILTFFERQYRGRFQIFRRVDVANQQKKAEDLLKRKGHIQIFRRLGGSFKFIREEGDPQLRVRWEKQNPGKGSGPEHGRYWF